MNSRNALMRSTGHHTRLVLLCILGSLGVTMPALAATTVTQFTYDAGNHVTSITGPRQLVTTYSYDCGLPGVWGIPLPASPSCASR